MEIKVKEQPNFSHKPLKNGLGVVTFKNETTGEYDTCPLEIPMDLDKAKRRSEMLNVSYALTFKELAK